ncbi:MAG TPA: hypothetical protein PLK24_01410 [Atribacter sp.]|jgi:hypothetical protein|uniref:hypothetical protein n=1 Tax=Atribacter sp. TaxID=2847780 RepID=UPI0017739FD9|nr:hypothetical protein [Atribacter sp.]MDD3713221.1 hypothetical protein [Atribacterota bacterium]MDI9595739.1 hypothetical protein [Atribacterota bacterium]HHT11371.1 hypothetical protein [Candidatus Atribacteria bacterium]HQK82577.1 hypothetical protein [Atribacter sp.]
MDTDWKDRIEKANALWERVNLLQEEIELIEKQLNEILQIEEEEILEEDSQSIEKKIFELFSQVLAELKQQEENILKVPPERWKKIQTREVLDLEKMSLDSLLGLYRKFLNAETNQPRIEIDDHFENLIEEQRDYINGFFDLHTGQWFRMDALFQNRQELRIVIATFLVLLDMVFRDLLKMKEEDGLVYLIKNE